MRALLVSAVITAALVKGVLIGLAIGGAIAACACRKTRPAGERKSSDGSQQETMSA